MLDAQKRIFLARAGDRALCLPPEMINRHGLISGATGTGKTVTLQTMAESFSALGVPVFLADIKGDLSGLCKPGRPTGKVAARVESLGLRSQGYANRGFPVCFWDVFGEQGHPLRATVSEMGPMLLSRLLQLNDVQTGLLSLIFRIADDSGLLLLDMKDLRLMVRHVGEHRSEYAAAYGNIASASIGAIQRSLLRLEEEGGDRFFGEPSLEVADLLRTAPDGSGMINILAADRLMGSPAVYATLLLWLLSELFERLPEIGDAPRPRLAFFFDEAHLLFRNMPPVLLEKVELVVRLIRSRGVGVYFVTQNPGDVPDSVGAQLGNRVQHALRAFTPREQRAVRAAAASLRPNPGLNTEQVIGELGVGEALVSLLDQNGTPERVERAWILPPESHVGPVLPEERSAVLAASPMGVRYDRAVDRESAYERLSARADNRQAESEEAFRSRETDGEYESPASKPSREGTRRRKEAEKKQDVLTDLFGSVAKQATRTIASTLGREIGKSILRGVLGGLFSKK